LDDAVERFADDGIIRGLDNRGEESSREQLTGVVPVQAPLHRHVPENQDASREVAPFVADRRGAVVDGILAAVFSNQHRVIRQPDDDALPKRSGRRVFDRLTHLLVHDTKHRVDR
jgi:hypothetical protein